MRKVVVGGIGLALGVSTVLASGAFAGGNGAVQRVLLPAVYSGATDNQCQQPNGTGAHGFTIFNAPGRPGATLKFNGEVSLKNAAPHTEYDVYLVPSSDSGNCNTPAGVIVTNTHGNGNAHLVDPNQGAGTYYVVLQSGGKEQYATTEATVS